ncbi:MAG: hypothetical protein LZF60_20024 [Nitrospira sp.]|nr:MAG: hypothetical protein LZF60_20024 [Nitrospira sp.]
MKRSWALVVVVVAALLLILAGFLILTGGLGLPVKWELPPGHKGWVTVRYLDASCAPIEQRGLFLVIKVSDEGTGCTSDFLARKSRYNIFEYVNSDGSRVKAESSWGESEYRPGGGLLDRWFIGTKSDLKQSGSTRPPTPTEWSNQNAGVHPSDKNRKE